MGRAVAQLVPGFHLHAHLCVIADPCLPTHLPPTPLHGNPTADSWPHIHLPLFPSGHTCTDAPAVVAHDPGALLYTNALANGEASRSESAWSPVTDAGNHLIWPVHFRILVTRGPLYIFSTLELMRPRTLTGSGAVYKLLDFKASVERV